MYAVYYIFSDNCRLQ